MCVSALIGLGSALIQGGAAKSAAKTQAKSGDKALDFQQGVFDAGQAALQPFNTAGRGALSAYNWMLGLGEKPEGFEGFQETDAFKNVLTAGADTIEARHNKNSGIKNGATMTALEEFRMGLASNEVHNFLSRYSNLANMGAQAGSAQAGVGSTFGQAGANTITDIGNAQAAGQIGVGKAISSGIDTGVGMYGFLNNQDNGGNGGQGYNSKGFKNLAGIPDDQWTYYGS